MTDHDLLRGLQQPHDRPRWTGRLFAWLFDRPASRHNRRRCVRCRAERELERRQEADHG